MEILILNGPNLNQYFLELKKHYPSDTLHYFQSNHEGALIDKLQEVGFEIGGIVFNPGGYTHTSIAIRDTINSITSPVIEVHISDIYQRESFRHHSYITDVALESIVGQGIDGYRQAVALLKK